MINDMIQQCIIVSTKKTEDFQIFRFLLFFVEIEVRSYDFGDVVRDIETEIGP